MEREIPLRITVLRPPRGAAFAVQRGRSELLAPARATDDLLSFDFAVRVSDGRADGEPNFLGPYTQGPPADRFVYVNSGTRAGEAGSRWERRAKVKLGGITWGLLEGLLATPGARLEARIGGTAKDGGPACATVPLLDGGWTLCEADAPTPA